MSRFVNIKRYRTAQGHSCMHCKRSATTTAIRVDKMRVRVWYCDIHADLIIEQGATREPAEIAGENSGGAS
jgi:hypothetical protein